MFFCHDSLSKSNNLYVFPSWSSIKKIMQKDNAKVGKISIFSSLDVKLKFLMNRVELTQFPVGSSRVELKICVTRLESSWKYEQLDFESSRIQNVNSKLDSMISLNLLLLWNCLRISWAVYLKTKTEIWASDRRVKDISLHTYRFLFNM